MDLTNLSIVELRNLQEQIARELKQRESQGVAKAREEIYAIAKSVGVPLTELLGGAALRAKSGGVAPRYRNPANASQQWTGRGRQPAWAKDWLAAGKSIDLLRI